MNNDDGFVDCMVAILDPVSADLVIRKVKKFKSAR